MNIIQVSSTIEIGDALSECRLRKSILLPRGGGSRMINWQDAPRSVTEIALTNVKDLVSFEPADFYVCCQTGMPLQQLFQTLSERRSHFPFLKGECPGTVGGMVASGQINTGEGVFNISRWVLAMQVMLADGTVIKTGAVTYKSVAGYDLPKLFCGSFGTLGIILEVVLRCYPERGRPYGKDLEPVRLKSPVFCDASHAPAPTEKSEIIARRIKHSFDPESIFPVVLGWNNA